MWVCVLCPLLGLGRHICGFKHLVEGCSPKCVGQLLKSKSRNRNTVNARRRVRITRTKFKRQILLTISFARAARSHRSDGISLSSAPRTLRRGSGDKYVRNKSPGTNTNEAIPTSLRRTSRYIGMTGYLSFGRLLTPPGDHTSRFSPAVEAL